MSCCFESRDGTVTSMKGLVIPAPAGIQFRPAGRCDACDFELDPGLRREDGFLLRALKRPPVLTDQRRAFGR